MLLWLCKIISEYDIVSFFQLAKAEQYGFHICSYISSDVLIRILMTSWEACLYGILADCSDWISGVGIRPLIVVFKAFIKYPSFTLQEISNISIHVSLINLGTLRSAEQVQPTLCLFR